jgi:hypothetical protein
VRGGGEIEFSVADRRHAPVMHVRQSLNEKKRAVASPFSFPGKTR